MPAPAPHPDDVRQFFTFLRAGDVNAVRDMLSAQRALANTPDDKERPPAVFVAQYLGFGAGPVLQALHEAGADFDLPDSWGNTVLHIAARERRNEIIQQVLDLTKGRVDVDALTDARISPLRRAVQEQNVAGALLLLDAKAEIDVDTVTDAAYVGATRLLEELLSRRPEFASMPDSLGSTALMWAADDDQFSTVGPNTGDYAATVAAIKEAKLECARKLLARGADPEEKNRDGLSALDIAEQANFPEMTQLLQTVMAERKAAKLAEENAASETRIRRMQGRRPGGMDLI